MYSGRVIDDEAVCPVLLFLGAISWLVKRDALRMGIEPRAWAIMFRCSVCCCRYAAFAAAASDYETTSDITKHIESIKLIHNGKQLTSSCSARPSGLTL